MTIGEKRNLCAALATNEYIVHMDDDDFYPMNSVPARIRILMHYEKKIGEPACVGCSRVHCYDLVSDQYYESFDRGSNGEALTISESTLAYSKEFFKK
jgi:hypothetical protein